MSRILHFAFEAAPVVPPVVVPQPTPAPGIIKQDVLEFAPELSKIKDGAWAAILAFVNSFTSLGIDIGGGEQSSLLRLARIFLAAHYGTVSRRSPSGAAGPTTSEAAGAVRRSYGLVALAANDAGFGSTGWGQQLLCLLSMSDAHGPFLV